MKRDLLDKVGEGRVIYIHPTPKSAQLNKSISEVWSDLYERYSKIIGKKQGDELTRLCLQASRKLHQDG